MDKTVKTLQITTLKTMRKSSFTRSQQLQRSVCVDHLLKGGKETKEFTTSYVCGDTAIEFNSNLYVVLRKQCKNNEKQ
jgi:hypothetical protein